MALVGTVLYFFMNWSVGEYVLFTVLLGVSGVALGFLQLRSKGIVKARRVGINVYYSIANAKIIQAFDLISEVLKESLLSQTEAVNEAIKK